MGPKIHDSTFQTSLKSKCHENPYVTSPNIKVRVFIFVILPLLITYLALCDNVHIYLQLTFALICHELVCFSFVCECYIYAVVDAINILNESIN